MTRKGTKQRLTAGELQNLLEEGNCEVVDIRMGWERAGRSIRGTQHVPMGKLRMESRKWAAGDPVVLVCKSGDRTQRAVSMLQKTGFSQVTDLAGGIDSWEAEGLEVERDPVAVRALAGQMRFVAVLLIIAGVIASRWWPPAIYFSEVMVIGFGMSLLAGWFGGSAGTAGDPLGRADNESSGTGCHWGGG